MKTWKEDEKTYKSNRLKEGLGLTTTILSNIEDKLNRVSEDNGWSCQKHNNTYEEGIKYVLTPIDPRDAESFTPYNEMISLIKEEFDDFDESNLTVEYTPHIRWMLPIISVDFH